MLQSGHALTRSVAPSFFTTEEQIYELFSRVGDIKRIIMGLDRNQKTPCGFCFVEQVQNRRCSARAKVVSTDRGLPLLPASTV